jgi:putative membrane protein
MNPWRPGWRKGGRDVEQDNGQEPDYRFTLANERTFLAWIRTALGLLAGGVLMAQFANRLTPRGLVDALSVGLALSAAAMSVLACRRWQRNQMAMRLARHSARPSAA